MIAPRAAGIPILPSMQATHSPVLLALVAAALASCDTAASSSGREARGLVVQNPSDDRRAFFHDFGHVPLGEVVSHTYEVRNTDPDPVTIQKIAPDCACAVPVISYLDPHSGERVRGRSTGEPVITVPPGALVELTIQIDTRHVRQKNIDKLSIVKLSCDSRNEPFPFFELHVVVDSPLQATPEAIELKEIAASNGGLGISKVITGVQGSPVQVLGIASVSEGIEAEVELLPESGVPVWVVTAKVAPGLPLGPFSGAVHLRVTEMDGSGEGPPYPIAVRATVVRDVILRPATVGFGRFSLVDGARAEAVVRAVIPGDRVLVTDAALVGTGAEQIAVAFEPVKPDPAGRSAEWRVELTAHPSMSVELFTGKLRVALDHPTVPELEVTYIGRTR